MGQPSMKDIPGFEGRYSITSEGRVWSFVRNRWLRGNLNTDGYRYFCLRIGGKSFYPFCSHLVLENFHSLRPEGHEADHENNIRHDDRLSNLQWVTHQENVSRVFSQGRRSMLGTKNSNGFLTEDIVLNIRKTRAETGRTYQQIADEFGLKKSHVADLITGRLWGHLPMNGELNV